MYDSDVIFQQILRQLNSPRGKKYIGDIHYSYKYNTQVSVLINVVAICCSNSYVFSIADTNTFRENKTWLKNVCA